MHSIRFKHNVLYNDTIHNQIPHKVSFDGGIATFSDNFDVYLWVCDIRQMPNYFAMIRHDEENIIFVRPVVDPNLCIQLRQQHAIKTLENPNTLPLSDSDDELLIRNYLKDQCVEIFRVWFIDQLPEFFNDWVTTQIQPIKDHLKDGQLYVRAWKAGKDNHMANNIVSDKNVRLIHVQTCDTSVDELSWYQPTARTAFIKYQDGYVVVYVSEPEKEEIHYRGTTCLLPWHEIQMMD